ncbi:MAG: OmpH family outer membrane protein [Phycisphaerae bacterium]|nr:OmpH family outer membrane protein [Phycisphaerae bacterium]MBN8598748.1 OmpH family outer membrane protein [Planctomycetota bacterium]
MKTGRRSFGRLAGFVGAGIVATGLAGFGAMSVRANSANAPSASKIALINIEKVINDLDEVKMGQQKIAAKADARQAELNNIAKQLDEGQKKLELIDPKDTNRREEAVKMMELNATANAKQQAFQGIINIEKGDLFKQVHGHIMDACANYAQKNDIELILVDDRVLTFQENDDVGKVSALISQKRIVYGAPALDITDDIIKVMNNNFAANGGKKPAPKKP